jgi:hypothetical protein
LVSEFTFDVTINVLELDSSIISNANFGAIDLKVVFDDLSHLIVEEAMRVFLPLDAFHHQSEVLKLVEVLVQIHRVRHQRLFHRDVRLNCIV